MLRHLSRRLHTTRCESALKKATQAQAMQYTSPRRDCDLSSQDRGTCPVSAAEFFLCSSKHETSSTFTRFENQHRKPHSHSRDSHSKACRRRHLGAFRPYIRHMIHMPTVAPQSAVLRYPRVLASRRGRIPKTTCRSCPCKARPYRPPGY